ncbi:CYFA0S06e03444g1_1 [Cyberlindnera fabianii]|uniref:CYFA0S06e03444g1_1 n=1 Tax=Cyberlindnera fabianii TaxID=36022 RepID=A0A061AU73_CYBFA|nr:Hydroxymethylpyrimidine/phosphomethylpyrimidine kinase THI20 [Cyberlindnera fabianii]CDR41186.1 CYFA0S06e03444g1_1 [Cyberlindnera fabianii]
MSTREIVIHGPALTPSELPTVLTVAGSDSSGGAGIEADLKTISAHGSYGLTCITALTAQNTTGVESISFTDRATLDNILEQNFKDVKVDVVKTGLMTLDAVNALDLALSKYHVGKPLVIDPVMVASTGAQLSGEDVLKVAVEKLFKRATLITPNVPETKKLLGLYDDEFEIDGPDSMSKAARIIHEKTGCLNVLVKGGHCLEKSDNAKYLTDVLYTSANDTISIFRSTAIDSQNTHGTGCTLASAISANLASGLSLVGSIESAIRYVHSAILSAPQLGHGHGPLNHVFHISSPALSTFSVSNAPFIEGHFVDYLISHPAVKPAWNGYVNHPFVAQLAEGTLPYSSFLQFVSQDYPYLVNYARIHSIAASVAPDMACIDREIAILTEIKHELGEHAKRLAAKGVVELESLQMNATCKAYCDYLTEVAKGGDWLEINVAMSPCLLGYYQAAKNVSAKDGIRSEYKEWLDTYTSESYLGAVNKGKQTLEKHSVGISYEKAQKLVKIFADVCLLEENFWSSALHETA